MIKIFDPDILFAMRDAELNALGYGVLITDQKGRIRFANDAFMALNGFERSELINQSCRLLQGPLTDSNTLDAMRLAQDEGREFSANVLNYRKDAQPFWVSVNICPLRDINGVLTHFIAVVQGLGEILPTPANDDTLAALYRRRASIGVRLDKTQVFGRLFSPHRCADERIGVNT